MKSGAKSITPPIGTCTHTYAEVHINMKSKRHVTFRFSIWECKSQKRYQQQYKACGKVLPRTIKLPYHIRLEDHTHQHLHLKRILFVQLLHLVQSFQWGQILEAKLPHLPGIQRVFQWLVRYCPLKTWYKKQVKELLNRMKATGQIKLVGRMSLLVYGLPQCIYQLKEKLPYPTQIKPKGKWSFYHIMYTGA